MSLTKLDDAHLMTPSAWYAYEKVEKGGKFEFAKPLPGFRIDYVFQDGRIGDYPDSGFRTGHCLAEQRTGLFPARYGRAFAHAARTIRSGSKPAVENCENCGCGYRIVRNPFELMRYAAHVQVYFQMTSKPHHTRLYGGHVAQYRGRVVAPALTRVVGSGTAERTFDINDPHGTIRVSKTRLVEVWLPTMTDEGFKVPSSTAQKIRDRYGVTVRKIDGDLLSFQGTPDIPMPDDWPHYLEPLREEIAEAKRFVELHGQNAAQEVYKNL